jgi:sugar lactone lactonase YvrE
LNRRQFTSLVFVLLLTFMPLLSSSFYKTSVGFQSGEIASVVLGQPNFTSDILSGAQSGLNGPEGIAIDSKGDIWISDSTNNRVVEFTPPFSNGESASLVLGQDNFSSIYCSSLSMSSLCDPQGIAFDKAGNLYVADDSNNRILEFKPPFSDGEAASLSIGTTQNDTTQSSLNAPLGIALDSSGNLWVADEGNQRVVEFKAPLATNESAGLVLGQPNFVSNSSGTNQSAFNVPNDLTFDHSGNLWVSDSSNHRILQFTTPFSNGENASLVIGQPNFTSDVTTESQSVFSSPAGLAFDSSGNLWATDTYNGRVLEFTSPFSDGENASLVIGQTGYNSSNTVPTQSTLVGPEGVAFDSSGNLWVLDSANSRAMMFTVSGAVATSSSVTSSSVVTSSSSTSSIAVTTTSTTSASTSSSSVSQSSAPPTTTTSLVTSSPPSTSTSAKSATSLSSAYVVIVFISLSVCLIVGMISALKRPVRKYSG